jgi:HPt (histidine-containing phosphotransfer) domain-containing protein
MGILSDVEDELLPELPRFFDNYDTDIEQLKDYLNNRNVEEIENTVHRMKGSSGSWGFHDIQNAAVELEKAAKARDWDAIESTLTALENKITEAKQAVEEELEES